MVELLTQAKAIKKRLAEEGPKDNNELHAWIKTNLGVDIPRTKVCEGHNAPFDFLADLFFERVGSAVLVANRGGSKTFMVAILHLLNSKFKAGCESGTIGAIENQAKRAYAHFLKFTRDDEGNVIKDIAQLKITETYFRNGSKLEILPGTKNSVNGPHWQKVHFDEVELADPEVYQESRNISTAKQLIDGRWIKAQDIITSTRKYPKGLMQEILDQIDDAMVSGKEAPFTLYKWCVFETSAQVLNQDYDDRTISCQIAYPDLDDDKKCPCHNVVKGTWRGEERTPRTLKDICKGRFARSGGWQPFSDVVNTFIQSATDIWEAQQECSRPSTENLYVPQFSRERHGVKNYLPNPDYGPIFMAVDFGGTNPHAVNWYQLLRYEIEAIDYLNNKIRLQEGTLVCFNEIYVAEIGNMKLASRIVKIEDSYRKRWRGWRVQDRFADPQAKAARLDFSQHKPPLRCSWRTTREFEEHVKIVRELFEDNKFVVDAKRCPMFCEEIVVWRLNPDTGKQIDEFNHCMSNFRYASANIEIIERNNRKGKSTPISTDRPFVKRDYTSSPSVPKSQKKNPEEAVAEEWQKRFVSVTRGF